MSRFGIIQEQQLIFWGNPGVQWCRSVQPLLRSITSEVWIRRMLILSQIAANKAPKPVKTLNTTHNLHESFLLPLQGFCPEAKASGGHHWRLRMYIKNVLTVRIKIQLYTRLVTVDSTAAPIVKEKKLKEAQYSFLDLGWWLIENQNSPRSHYSIFIKLQYSYNKFLLVS